MNLEEAVATRRSIRSFEDRPVPREVIDRAISLAVQAPAPHHSAPWRFAILDTAAARNELAVTMGEAWRADLRGDGYAEDRIDTIVERSHRLLTSTPVLVICCAEMSRAHAYADARRARAEWSLFAHSVGAALQTFMLALAEDGVGSCWISAPVFCGETVKAALGLPDTVEPHALVLVGYPDPAYRARPRDPVAPDRYVIAP